MCKCPPRKPTAAELLKKITQLREWVADELRLARSKEERGVLMNVKYHLDRLFPEE